MALDDIFLQEGPCAQPGGQFSCGLSSITMPKQLQLPPCPAQQPWCSLGQLYLPADSLQGPVTLNLACVGGATLLGPAWVGTAGTGAVEPPHPVTLSLQWTTP